MIIKIKNKLVVLELMVNAVLCGLGFLGMGSEEGSGRRRSLVSESSLWGSHLDSVTNPLDLPVGDGQEYEAIHGPPGQAVTQISTELHPHQGWETQQLFAGQGPVLVHSLQDLVIQGQDILHLRLREPMPAGRKDGHWNTPVSSVLGGLRS